MDWIIHGLLPVDKSYDCKSLHEAVACFEAELGWRVRLEDPLVMAHCCLCGFAILATDDNRNAALPGTWVHWPVCPGLDRSLLDAQAESRLVPLVAALPDGFEPFNQLILSEWGQGRPEVTERDIRNGQLSTPPEMAEE